MLPYRAGGRYETTNATDKTVWLVRGVRLSNSNDRHADRGERACDRITND
jgi:hypothetical protein